MIDGKLRQQNPLVISLCGPSSVGKSRLALALVQQLGDEIASRVPADYFFVPRPALKSYESFLAVPLMWDWSLLASRLALPEGAVTSTPDADFETFRRFGDQGGPTFTIRPVMICDAMAPYPRSDVVVLMEAPTTVRRARLAERDRRWGTRVAHRWQHLERTWLAASVGVEPDIVLDATELPCVTVASLICKIEPLLWRRCNGNREGERP